MKQKVELRIANPEATAETGAGMAVSNFHVWFGETHILKNVNAVFRRHEINCIVGPSGGGKSTLLRSMNRINDEVEGFAFDGEIYLDGQDITAGSVDVTRLRTEVGMVFQKPCVFPKSIAENVLFGIQRGRKLRPRERLELVEEMLKSVSLWREVAHRLHDPASSLSIGQQQRLCIARTLAVKPKGILLDEPTASLDPVATRRIEELLLRLKEKYTIVFVTHNIQQARRIADQLIFMCDGQIIEQGPKQKLFSNPDRSETRAYLNDEYCDC